MSDPKLIYTVFEIQEPRTSSDVRLLGTFTTLEAAEKRALYQKQPRLSAEYAKSGVYEVKNDNANKRVLVVRSVVDETDHVHLAGEAIDSLRGVEKN